MYKIFLVLAILSIPFAAKAQSSYSVNLTWTASTSSTSANPGSVKVLRATGSCPASGIGSLVYSSLNNTAPAAGPYTDSTVVAGTTYCYYITATVGSSTSGPSNTFQAVIPTATAPPSSLGGKVTQVTVTVTSN